MHELTEELHVLFESLLLTLCIERLIGRSLLLQSAAEQDSRETFGGGAARVADVMRLQRGGTRSRGASAARQGEICTDRCRRAAVGSTPTSDASSSV